jgi:anthranilate synthase component 1
MVNRAEEYIRAGDIFQMVPAQRFETAFAGDPLELYRTLRFINPSPYMFCLRFPEGYSLVGSSPEVHVRLTGDLVEIRPIAGTRKRGSTEEEDESNARELLSDPKERAEHLMLVDLARNDVGRIAGMEREGRRFQRRSSVTVMSCISSRTSRQTCGRPKRLR